MFVALQILGVVGPIIFAATVVVDRGGSHARWARPASIIAAAIGVAWGVLGYAIAHHLYSTRFAYFEMLALKHLSAGLAMGFITSILMALGYNRITKEESSGANETSNKSLQPTAPPRR